MKTNCVWWAEMMTRLRRVAHIFEGYRRCLKWGICRKDASGSSKISTSVPLHVQPSAAQPQQVVSPMVADVVKRLMETSPSIDQILKDSGIVEKTVYHVMAQPVGFRGSPVSFKVTKKYAIGTRITRVDGRSYKIYRVKKTKETKAVSTTVVPMWRAIA
jgi:hypothetical protein